MKKHLFVIDPLEKLQTSKDSSLLMAHTSKREGLESYVTFPDQCFLKNRAPSLTISCWEYETSIKDSFYLDTFGLGEKKNLLIDQTVTIHLRKDPPFDRSYLHFCWILQEMKKTGATLLNDPSGILLFNEKIMALAHKKAIPSYIGTNPNEGLLFLQELQKEGHAEAIIKPLDLFQGQGVTKLALDPLPQKLPSLPEGAFILQPFIPSVQKGEVRATYFASTLLGAILKRPRPGDFLTNIARGGSFEKMELPPLFHQKCLPVCQDLQKKGVFLVAFDLLGGEISEVNITCPGLLVELSSASKKNVCQEIFKKDQRG